MPYIADNLMPNEHIMFCTKKHLIIFLYPVLWTIFSFFAYAYMHANPILATLDWAPWLLAGLFWGVTWLDYHFSVFALTDKRLMMREGFFYRHSNEVRLAAISQVNVDQSLLGQWLGYGTVSINAFGASDCYSMINKPDEFRKLINNQVNK